MKNPYRTLYWIAVAILIVFAYFGYTQRAEAASPVADQCVEYLAPGNLKVDTSDDLYVLPAGLLACIHASNGNTGQFITDGVSTLGDYIKASGLLNEGGQVPGVSNYVIYGGSQPSTAPSATPTSTPTPTPDPTPTVTPTPRPSKSPGFDPGPKWSPKVETSIPTQPARTYATPPATNTTDASVQSEPTQAVWGVLALLALVFGVTVAAVEHYRTPRRRR